MIVSEFNLLDEPWLLVMDMKDQIKKVSLLDALIHAHEYQRLAGELPTQNAAILRLLLAIVYATIGKMQEEGKLEEFETEDQAADYWKELWDAGKFPENMIQDYLEIYRDRFYLFDEHYPFYQVPVLAAKEKNGEKITDFTAAKLNGILSEGQHTNRLFPMINGKKKDELQYDEAARWLIHFNAFDDTSVKPKGAGVGWMGKLGLILIDGNNLYQTLLLNLAFPDELFPDPDDNFKRKESPTWEVPIKIGADKEISVPDNLSELYTLQSRMLLLKREGNIVTGVRASGGNFFKKENAFIEPMTEWKKLQDDKGTKTSFEPKVHDPSRQMWRDCSSILGGRDGDQIPGVVKWIRSLERKGLSLPTVQIRSIAAIYGNKNMLISDIFEDVLTIPSNIFQEYEERWISLITKQVEVADALVVKLGNLAHDIALASGQSGDNAGKKDRMKAKEKGYYALDLPFRSWLEQIGSTYLQESEAADCWWKQAREIVCQLAEEMVQEAGNNALVGRIITIKEGETEKKKVYSAAKAYNQFLLEVSSRERLMKYKQGV